MQALDLIGPIYRMKDSFVGVREQASVLFAYGLLLMRQDEYEEARYMLQNFSTLIQFVLGPTLEDA